MATPYARANDPSPRTRSFTPPPIQTAVEYLSTSTLVQNISILLSIPRDTSALVHATKAGSRSKRASKGTSKARRHNGKARKPLPLTSWQHGRQNSLSVPRSPIDTLAAVASAESFIGHERPAKRARSEVLVLSNQIDNRRQYTSSRPATSHLASQMWGKRHASTVEAGQISGNSGVTYTSDEQLVADSLLDLFRRGPSSPLMLSSKFPSARLRIPQPQTSQRHDSTWTINELDDRNQSIERSPGQLSRPNGAMSRTLHAEQIHTPPEEMEVDKVTQHDQDDSSMEAVPRLPTVAQCDEEATQELTPHMAPAQQLHSPQSLSADAGRIKVKKRKGKIKRESISDQQGLGISVVPLSSQTHVDEDALNTESPNKSSMLLTDVNGFMAHKPQAAANLDDTKPIDEETKCVECGFFANSLTGDTMDWLQCNGCSGWLHFACTGFSKKEIERIDKFHCNACRTVCGPTTFVRKSARNRTNVDYSSLNEGFFSTVEEHHEHRYVKHFKARDMKHILPETFPRIAPEDLTLEYLERLPAVDEPIVIPRALNPRPWNMPSISLPSADHSLLVPELEEADFEEQEITKDVAQDRLDMVIPEGLTVRRVAEIHGLNMPLEVIDVKLQEGDSRKWTVGKWADYYEAPGDKAIRNVISLEVSYSPLGKLLRRPKVVRDLDLQDAVWPESDSVRKAVKFYVLMSVSDCYTDFHIDFGGSSVYYHVLRGKKVFFFIPPTKQNLKKYEEWCISPAQSETFLPDQTKQCYRIDLEEGDTMIIPSGWIHAVWTPTDSLVVGGNFLTKLHLGMQLRINELEKNTGVETKFRYPFFQKVQWYTVAKYLEDDPVPQEVETQLLEGQVFYRDQPVWHMTTDHVHEDDTGSENVPKSTHYYAKTEVEGWPELLRFIFRTVLIHLDRLEGITKKTRAAVSRSIPKSINDPLGMARRFACWIAWKNGNEQIAEWVLPGAVLPTRIDAKVEKAEKVNLVQSESRPARRATSMAAEVKTSHRLGPKKVVCDVCREKKVACKHVDAQTLAKLTEGDLQTLTGETSEQEPNGDGVVSKQRDREIVGRLSVNADGKRRWGKACVECRRSKRRCIHDETGKIDPHKQKQLAAALRNHASDENDIDDYDDEMLADFGSDEIEIDPALLEFSESIVNHGDGEDLVQQLVKAATEDEDTDIKMHQSISHEHGNEQPAVIANAVDNGQLTIPPIHQEDLNGNEAPQFDLAQDLAGDASADVRFTSKSTPRRSTSSVKVEEFRNRQSLSPTVNKKMRKSSREPMSTTQQPTSTEEEESLRIAMELQAQDFGLRSRRSAGS